MNSQRESGSAMTGFVLLLLALGMLMLSGLQQQLNQQRHVVASEVAFLKKYVAAVSALAWGSQLSWHALPAWQCQQFAEKGWKACLMATGNHDAVMAAHGSVTGKDTPLVLWRWGRVENNRWLSIPRGWADFCPLGEESLCQLPQ